MECEWNFLPHLEDICVAANKAEVRFNTSAKSHAAITSCFHYDNFIIGALRTKCFVLTEFLYIYNGINFTKISPNWKVYFSRFVQLK